MNIPDHFDVPGDVHGLRVVLTGASRGLGRVLAFAFAHGGARLALVARQENDLKAVLESLPGDHIAVPADISDPESNDRVADETVAHLGGVDVWIANAGISPFVAALPDTEPAAWRRVVDVNLNGTFYGIRAASRVMTAGGRILVTGSVLAERPRPGLSAYATTKAALIGLVRAAAVDLASAGITVNLVAPGWFDSPLTAPWRRNEDLADAIMSHTPMNRWGRSQDLPGIYLFLASRAAGFITGETVAVDGGYLSH